MTNLVLQAAAGGSSMSFLSASSRMLWQRVQRWLPAAVFMALLSVLTLRLIPLMLR